MSSLYKDSKTFVDKKLKYPAGKIIKNFETLVNEQNGELLSLEQIKQVKIFPFEIYFYISLSYLFIKRCLIFLHPTKEIIKNWYTVLMNYAKVSFSLEPYTNS